VILEYRTVIVRKAEKEDAYFIGPRLRKADLIEIRSFHDEDSDPSDLLAQGMELSGDDCWTLTLKDGTPVAMFGVTNCNEHFGAIWMMGTPQIKDIHREFLRHCKDWMPVLHQKYPLLGNVVYAKNDIHIKWLKFMGFQFIAKHKQLGNMDLPFYEFIHKQ
jgi:hypothetical protein